MLKRMAPLLRLDLNALRGSFGSSDYKSAGEMRDIFVTVVRENLEASARKIKCPVQLIYGALDTETPPEIGERFLSMIPDATLASLEHHDHQSLLMEGRHQVARLLSNFVKAT
jgi:pimeloyl-ACP methyl ester carboxylesterase